MIAIIDYGVGNIRAFSNIFKQLNIPIKIASKTEDLVDATKIILPGVGAFDYAMEQLEKLTGMKEKLDQLVLTNKMPVIGICVGMQMLANRSDEGKKPGLGWIDGSVKKFDEREIKYATHLPHMGWNDIKIVGESRLFHSLDKDSKYYFLHSYYFECHKEENVIATSLYGKEFCCAVNENNIYGVQFHPEKSHHYGIQLLENFAKL